MYSSRIDGSHTSMKMQAVLPPSRARRGHNPVMEETLPVALGARIRAARKHARLTQAQLGERLAVADHSAVGQWERGEVLIGTENLIFCAEECGASLDYLVWGMGNNIDARILALPAVLREQLVNQFNQRIEEAEKLV